MVEPSPVPTEAKGIHQSDIIIRSALLSAIDDLRANPYLLDSVFASLVYDDKTSKSYGDKEVQKAKKWFLATDVPVIMDYKMKEEPENAFVTISLVDSSEDASTLSDIHYQTTEDVEPEWPALTSFFTPKTYDIRTGVMVLPESVVEGLVVVPGMLVIDHNGKSHPITAADDNVITLSPGDNADFKKSLIKGQKPKLIQQVESVVFKETYRIGVTVHGDASFLTWLHSIVVFCLLRYKQRFLEARGFERSVQNSAPFSRNDAFGKENVWTRYITISGYVRQYWPKDQYNRILSTSVSPLKVAKVDGASDPTFIPEDGFSEEDSPWLTEDGIGPVIK